MKARRRGNTERHSDTAPGSRHPSRARRYAKLGVYHGQHTDHPIWRKGLTAVRDYDTLRLPAGYRLDLVGDPCVVTLCRSNGTVVGYFTHATDPEELRRAAKEDREGEGGASIHPIA